MKAYNRPSVRKPLPLIVFLPFASQKFSFFFLPLQNSCLFCVSFNLVLKVLFAFYWFSSFTSVSSFSFFYSFSYLSLSSFAYSFSSFSAFVLDGGRNFEQPIFRNLKIANVKSYERSSYLIFLFSKLFIFLFF